MNGLETVKGRVGKVVEEGIAVVEAGGDKGICKSDGSVSVKERTYLSKGKKLEESRLSDSRNVGGERIVLVKCHAKIWGSFGRDNNVVLKRDGRTNDFGALLWSAYKEEFGFRRVEGKFIDSEPVVKRVKGARESGEAGR